MKRSEHIEQKFQTQKQKGFSASLEKYHLKQMIVITDLGSRPTEGYA